MYFVCVHVTRIFTIKKKYFNKQIKKQNNRLILFIFIILNFFILQSCNPHATENGMVCSHPWVAIGFDSEVINTTTGEVDTWTYKHRYPEHIHTLVRLPLGIDSFDNIARKYEVYEMVQMYRTNSYPLLFKEMYEVYPLNVFLVENVDNRGDLIYDFMNEIIDETSIVYVRKIDCSIKPKKYCRDALGHYKPKP